MASGAPTEFTRVPVSGPCHSGALISTHSATLFTQVGVEVQGLEFQLYTSTNLGSNLSKFPGGGGLVTKLCPTLAIPWSVAHQAPLSMGFSRQEYWSG